MEVVTGLSQIPEVPQHASVICFLKRTMEKCDGISNPGEYCSGKLSLLSATKISLMCTCWICQSLQFYYINKKQRNAP